MNEPDGPLPAATSAALPSAQLASTELVPGLVSVALCTFNGSRFLHEQIESLLDQRNVELEVVISDDDSSDDTWPLLQSWAAREPRIRLFRNAGRLGYAANFAQAMTLCRGEFIAPCDQDDIWSPDKLSRLVSHMGEHVLCYCDSALIDEQGRNLGQRVSHRLGVYQGSGMLPLCFWNNVSAHALVFHRRVPADAWTFPLDCFHDWWLTVVAANSGSVGYVDEPLEAYRQHGRSQTDIARRRSHARDSWSLYRRRELWREASAALPGPDQAYCKRLSELWSARANQWWCPALCHPMTSRHSKPMRLNKRERFARFALKQYFGQRWRPRGRAFRRWHQQ